MTDKHVKISLSTGNVSFHYDGPVDCLKEEIEHFVKEALPLFQKGAGMNVTPPHEASPVTGHSSTGSAAKSSLSTNTIATKMGATTGTDLTLAAAAKLTLIEGKEVLSRTEIHDEMKNAPTFYKSSHSSNLSKHIDSLVKNGKLNFISKDKYAISAKEKTSLEKALADN